MQWCTQKRKTGDRFDNDPVPESDEVNGYLSLLEQAESITMTYAPRSADIRREHNNNMRMPA